MAPQFRHATPDDILRSLATENQRLLAYDGSLWDVIFALEADGLIRLVHGARRGDDYLALTDAGRAALEGME